MARITLNENPFVPAKLVYTPQSVDEIFDRISQIGCSQERAVATLYSTMTWNLVCKMIADLEDKDATALG